MRESGILLPIFALPSKYGIGCFSKEAYEFVDQLKEAGQVADPAVGTYRLRRFSLPVFFDICRESIFYRSENTEKRRASDQSGVQVPEFWRPEGPN